METLAILFVRVHCFGVQLKWPQIPRPLSDWEGSYGDMHALRRTGRVRGGRRQAHFVRGTAIHPDGEFVSTRLLAVAKE